MDDPADTHCPSAGPSVRACAVVAMLAIATAGACRGGDRDALLHIVQDQCLPHWRAQQDPAPCTRVMGRDFALLKDRKGGAHYLLIATATVRGIEDPVLTDAEAPNYFGAAWQARDRLEAVMGMPIADDAVGLAVNSAIARGQDQLHIHIECLGQRMRRLLQTDADRIGERWAPLPGSTEPFLARRIPGRSLDGVNPFQLLAREVPGARRHMGDYTLVLAAVGFKDGPGFVLLTGRTASGAAALLPAHGGLVPPGETLLDSTCEAARTQVQLPSSPPEEPPPSSQPPASLMPKSGPPRSGFGSGGG